MQTDKITEQEIRNILAEILKRREFQDNNNGQNSVVRILNSIWEAILEWVRKVFGYRPGHGIRIDYEMNSPVLQPVAKILLFLASAAILFFLARLLAGRIYRKGRLGQARIPTAYDYLKKPEEAISGYFESINKGEYSWALRFLYIAILLEFDRRKLIRIEKWKTNRMYIREIGLKDQSLVSPMAEFSSLFDECCYGNRAVDEISVLRWFEFYKNQKEKPV